MMYSLTLRQNVEENVRRIVSGAKPYVPHYRTAVKPRSEFARAIAAQGHTPGAPENGEEMTSPGVDLSGKVACITGGGQGLGASMAAGLAEAGADIVLIGRRPEPMVETAKQCEKFGVRARPAVCDVTDPARVNALFEQVNRELGGPHILINSAGVSLPSPILEMTDELWHQTIDLNLSGMFYCCRAAVRYMLEAGGGKIVNLGSGAGSRGRPNQVAYAASKSGVRGFTEALAVELAEKNIQVNNIAPGRFPTPMTQGRIADPAQSEEFLRYVPMKRYGEIEEIRPLVVYLCGPQSDYITGQTIYLDGGSSAL